MESREKIILCNDLVHLFNQGVLVAKGRILQVDPHTTCHGVPLGNGRANVMIMDDVVGDARLPIPNGDAETIHEALGGFVIWNMEEIYLASEDLNLEIAPPSDEITGLEVPSLVHTGEWKPAMDVDQEMEFDNVENANVEEDEMSDDEGPNLDYSDRSKWNKQLVELFSANDKIPLAKGVITLFCRDDAINNTTLGDDHVGVLIFDLICDVESPERKSELPLYALGSPYLVKWPLILVKIVDTGKFLGEILQQKDEVISGTNDQAQGVLKGDRSISDPREKRPYNFNTRKPADPNLKRKRELEKKKNQMITEEAITECRNKECDCKNHCCRFMSREGIKDARCDYWGLSHDDRLAYVYDQFRLREKTVVDSGKMIFDKRIVCKRGFYQGHGFSKGTFYNYERDYKAGAKKGFHGNKGTAKASRRVVMTRAFLNHYLIINGEPMPHLKYDNRNKTGTDNICYRLPSCYSREDIASKVGENVKAMGFESASYPTFCRIWRKEFDNYSFHKQSAFAKCEICASLKARLSTERRVVERAQIEDERDKHLYEQKSRRNLYYANRTLAQLHPDRYLSIIHDKMDQAKTHIPRMMTKMKSLMMSKDTCPIPMTLIGMLTHGREPGVYGHFGLGGLWPGDPDITITSLAKCFRDLESFTGDKSGDLISQPLPCSNPLFKALLDQTAFRIGYLETRNLSVEKFRGDSMPTGLNDALHNDVASDNLQSSFQPLPRHLTLQLDNTSKDNKNWAVMAFCSELVVRGIFETVQMSFLMVGHTHEDVDAFFSRVNSQISHCDVTTFPGLMAEMWDSESRHPVPRLMQEVANYKAYAKSFVQKIYGQSLPIAFLFSMRQNEPIYQVKEGINDPWMPPQGRVIWNREKDTNIILLPQGEPTAKPIQGPHPKSGDIVKYIDKYSGWLKETWTDEMSEGYRQMTSLVTYWENIRRCFDGSVSLSEYDRNTTVPSSSNDQPKPLMEGFWPRTNHGTGYIDPLSDQDTITVERDSMEDLDQELMSEIAARSAIFVGARGEKEREQFVPALDIHQNYFVIIRPNDVFEQQAPKCIWLGLARSEVHKEIGHPHKDQFEIQWWRPKMTPKILKSLGVRTGDEPTQAQRYNDFLHEKRVWEVDPGYDEETQKEWMEGCAVIYSWKPRIVKGQMPSKIVFNQMTKETIREYLARIE